MNKIKIILFFFSLLIYSQYSYGDTIEIKVKINNEIITNIDIENEKKYLYFLNPKLSKLESSQVENLAKNSLITEIIKKIELQKIFDFPNNYHLVSAVEKKLIKKKNINNIDQFKKVLENLNLNYFTIKE